MKESLNVYGNFIDKLDVYEVCEKIGAGASEDLRTKVWLDRV